MPSTWVRGKASLRAAPARGSSTAPGRAPPAPIDVAAVGTGIVAILTGFVAIFTSLIPTMCGGFVSVTARAVSATESAVHDDLPWPLPKTGAWDGLRADFERFRSRERNGTNTAIEWITFRYHDKAHMAERPRGDNDDDATPAGQFEELIDEWGQPLVVLLPWEYVTYVGVRGSRQAIPVHRGTSPGDELIVFSLGPDGLPATRDDIAGMYWLPAESIRE